MALKSLGSYWLTPSTSPMLLCIPCAAPRGTILKLSRTEVGRQVPDWCFSEKRIRSGSSVHIRLIFTPKYIFDPMVLLLLMLPLFSCPPLNSSLSPCNSSLSWSFLRGPQRLLKFCPWALIAHRHLPGHLLEHQVWPPCEVPGCGGWGGRGWLWAVMVLAPQKCSEVEVKSRQVAKTWQGGRGIHSGCCQLPSTEGFPPSGLFLGSEGTGYLYSREQEIFLFYTNI